jgi:DNA-binding MarR family transcriptional regulator
VVFRAYAKALTAAIGDMPGGPRGYFILSAAVRGQAGSQRSLAERLGVDRTVMTYLLDDLERADLVERRPDPADRRSRHIVATEHGQARWEALRGPVEQAEMRILEALPGESQEAFRSTLCMLAGHVSRSEPTTHPCAVVEDLAASEKPTSAPRRGRRRTTS